MMGIMYALACIGGGFVLLVGVSLAQDWWRKTMWAKVDEAELSARKAWAIINKPAAAYAVACPTYGILDTFGSFEDATKSADENGGKVVKLIAVDL